MSYDLAVWEGDRPANDRAAAAEFEALYDRYIESNETVEPTERIAAYVAALLARFPDIDTDAGDESPWSSGPLMSEASGPLVYFPMVWSRCDEVWAWAAEVAEQELSDVDEVIRAFAGFLENDPTIPHRFAWHPYAV